MPYVRRRRAPLRRKKPAVRRRRQQVGYRSKPKMNIFTETQKVGTECGGINSQGEVAIAAGTSGQGVKLITQLSLLNQVGSYKNLWSAYKILKAKFTIIPKWRGEAFNEAALGVAAGLGIAETPRFAYAINDQLPNLVPPLTEGFVLEDNGCKIRMFTKPVTITCRPRAVLEQQSQTVPALPNVNTQQGKQNPWIEFDDAGPNVQHAGVDGFFSTTQSAQSGFMAIADVYCTVTFACKDPR